MATSIHLGFYVVNPHNILKNLRIKTAKEAIRGFQMKDDCFLIKRKHRL